MEEVANRKAKFLEELESEIRWEWHWEKLNRRVHFWTDVGTWLSRFIILAAASYALATGAKDIEKVWIVIIMIVFATLNFSLPVLSAVLKSQQRQEVHDYNARRYSVIKTELLAGTITFQDAVKEFAKIRSEPTERTVRSTP